MKKIVFLNMENVLVDSDGNAMESAVAHFKQMIYDTGAVIVSINKKYDSKYIAEFIERTDIDTDVKGDLTDFPVDCHGDSELSRSLCKGNAVDYYLRTMDWKDEEYTYLIVDTSNDYLLRQGHNLITVDPDTGFSGFDEVEADETLSIIPSHRYTPSEIKWQQYILVPKEPEPLPPCCNYRSEQEIIRDNKAWKKEMAKYEQEQIAKKQKKLLADQQKQSVSEQSDSV